MLQVIFLSPFVLFHLVIATGKSFFMLLYGILQKSYFIGDIFNYLLFDGQSFFQS